MPKFDNLRQLGYNLSRKNIQKDAAHLSSANGGMFVTQNAIQN